MVTWFGRRLLAEILVPKSGCSAVTYKNSAAFFVASIFMQAKNDVQ